METWTLTRLGDAALVASCGQRIDPALNGRVVRVATALRARPLRGVRDVVESYCAVTVHFDPCRTDLAALEAAVREAIEANGGAEAAPRAEGGDGSRLRTIPVCYGGAFGPDLAAVAHHAGLPEDEVTRRHSRETYRVFMLGFLPGFAYMGPVPEEIAAPRRPSPRAKVPAGAVGIAGRQTGVYPIPAPGGWQLIGRTPLRTFDPDRAEPFLFRVGDRVRFAPISAEDYAAKLSHPSRDET